MMDRGRDRNKKSGSTVLENCLVEETSSAGEHVAAPNESRGLRANELGISDLSADNQVAVYVQQEDIEVTELPLNVPWSPESWTRDEEATSSHHDVNLQMVLVDDTSSLPRTSTPCVGQSSPPLDVDLSRLSTPAKNDRTASTPVKQADVMAQLNALSEDLNRSHASLNDHGYSTPVKSTWDSSAKKSDSSAGCSTWQDGWSKHSYLDLSHLNCSRDKTDTTYKSTSTKSETQLQQSKHGIKKVDWLDDPDDLNPETCDLIYFTPKHLRSRRLDEDGNRSLTTSDEANEIVARANDACATMEQIMAKHLDLIKVIPDADDQRKEHRNFLDNPLVKIHYEKMALSLKSMQSMLKVSRSSELPSAESRASTPGPSRPVNERNTRKRNVIPDGIYVISIKSKDLLPIDTKAVFDDAVQHCGIHADLVKKEGMNIEVHLRTPQDRDAVMDALANYRYIGNKLEHYFTITDDAKSPYLLRTNVIGKRTLALLKFIKDGKLSRDEAMAAILSRNKGWFHKSEDIVGIQLRESTNPAGKYLQVLITEEAHERVQDGIKRGMRLDLVYAQLEVHIPLSITNCYRCCDPGHEFASCKGPLRCRFCTGSHTNKRPCPEKEGKAPITCFRCTEYNASLAPYDWHLEKPVSHLATHRNCPIYSVLRKQVIQRLSAPQSSSKRARYN